MSLSFNSDWDDFHFDRKDSLRLPLQSLESALSLRLLRAPTEADLAWFQRHVEDIFRRFIPPPEGRQK